jgi:hypothetical protein
MGNQSPQPPSGQPKQPSERPGTSQPPAHPAPHSGQEKPKDGDRHTPGQSPNKSGGTTPFGVPK